jgi:PAS domain S-box-containing protein
LRTQHWDVILSDYAMHHFGGPAALNVLKATELDIPFLIVSGSIGEEQANALMHAGARDYILKDRMARLLPAVERELREAEGRRQRRRAEQAREQLAREHDALLARLQLQIEAMPIAYFLLDPSLDHIIDWNRAAVKLFGYTRQEILGQSPWILVPSSARPHVEETFLKHRQGLQSSSSIHDNLTRQGKTVSCEWHNTVLRGDEGAMNGLLCMAIDLTERKLL